MTLNHPRHYHLSHTKLGLDDNTLNLHLLRGLIPAIFSREQGNKSAGRKNYWLTKISNQGILYINYTVRLRGLKNKKSEIKFGFWMKIERLSIKCRGKKFCYFFIFFKYHLQDQSVVGSRPCISKWRL